jgi:hypothetical protein
MQIISYRFKNIDMHSQLDLHIVPESLDRNQTTGAKQKNNASFHANALF